MPQKSRQRTLLTRPEISDLISKGHNIVIIDNLVLKTDAWLPYHPGGDKAILHMVGRDATNEVRAFHSAETLECMRRYAIGRVEDGWVDFVPPIQGGVFCSGEAVVGHPEVDGENDVVEMAELSSEGDISEEPSPVFDGVGLRRRRGSSTGTSSTSLESLDLDEAAIPPRDDSILKHSPKTMIGEDLSAFPDLDAATQKAIIQKYRALDVRIRAAGLYDCNYTAYLFELLRYTTLAALSYYALRQGYYTLSAIFLGLLWHQLVFTVHDAGHMGITHNYHIDTFIGILIADFIGGLSVCWWKRNHNVHHLVTNSPAHDPDIQHMPFFAITPKFLQNLTSTYYDRPMPFDRFARWTLKYQHYLYYPILLFGRFNLYFLSWEYILLNKGPRKGPARHHRWLELAGQLFFWYWFWYRLLYLSLPSASARIAYVLISHFVTTPVHVQITLSHFAMSTADLGVAESFPQRMLRTTMDISCPPWLDFLHGGLQFQAVHHLFPRVPRHNLRACVGFVKEFCEEVGIPYAVYGFVEGEGRVLGRLGEVAEQVKIMGECAGSLGVQDVFEAH